MANEQRLIDANALLEFAKKRYGNTIVPSDIVSFPAVDAVSRCVHDQVRWERDIAIEQLESYGISLGEKAEVVKVVRCKDCARCIKGYCTIRKDGFGATLKVCLNGFCSDAERRKIE